MKKIRKISIVGAVGGSVLIVDNVFDIHHNNAHALTQETDDKVQQQKRAGSLAAILNFLLNDELVTNDSYVTQQDTALNISANLGVLSNDNALPSDTVTLVQDVQHGILTLNPDGSFDYLPDIAFTGNDLFIYRLLSANGQSADGTVTIKVNGVPDAIDDDFALDNSVPFLGNVVTNIIGGSDIVVDGAQVDPVEDADTALGGKINIQANGDFDYTPPANLGSQQDSFVYTLRDTDGETDTATITWQLAASISGIEQPITVLENAVLTSSFTIFTPVGLDYLQVNGTQFTLAELTAATVPAPLTVSGEVRGEFSITGYDQATGVLTYRYDPNGTSQDHTGAANDLLRETIALSVKDTSLSSTTDADLLIDIADTNPVAVDDARSISEGASAIAGNSVGIVGSASGDNADTLTDSNASPVTAIRTDTTNGAVGGFFASDYGSFSINTAGVYTYSLDNTNPSVQGLKSGASLAEVFTYTITDGDGDTNSATLSVTINGIEDALPSINIADNNGAAPGNQSVGESSSLSFAMATINASANMATSGAALAIKNESNNTTSLTLDQLNSLGTDQVNIIGANGVLTLTDFNASSGALRYDYDPTDSSQDHSAGPNSLLDQFELTATDNEGDTSNPVILGILVTDTNPIARADTNAVGENDGSVTGNAVFSTGASAGDVADTFNDANATPVTGIAFGATNGTVGAALAGSFGALTINSSGNYTYALDETNQTLQALKDADSLQETFVYTVEDGDGTPASSTITLSITGVDDPAPSITIQDLNGAENGEASVLENQSGMFGNVTLTTSIGFNSTTALNVVTLPSVTETRLTPPELTNLSTTNVTIVGTYGTLTLTDFDPSTGVLSYQFTSNQGPFDHSGATEFIERFNLTVIDVENDNFSSNLSILIEDTAATANDDARSISEGSGSIVGNAVSANGAATGDVADITDNTSPVIDVDFEGVDGTPGLSLSGSYGAIVLNDTGAYSYSLSNDNPSVQGLKTGESLIEVFTYAIDDAEGETDTANLTVTINGVEDDLPTTTIPDNNGAGTVGKESVAENATLTNRTLTLTASAGLAATGTALTISNEASTSTPLTLSMLNNLNANSVVINGADGVLTLADFSAGVLTYNYEPNGTRRDHSAGDTSVIEEFRLQVTDNEGDTSTENTLSILITDTAPTAAPDNGSITEDRPPNTITGDVITNDTQGSDTAVSVSQVVFASNPQTVGTPFSSQYGSLDLNSDGTYTYTLDNANNDVQALRSGESLVEVFNYSIIDTDGDTSTTTLTVNINGEEEPPEVTIPNNDQGVAGSDLSVVENLTINGSLTINSEVGLLGGGTALSIAAANATTQITLSQLLNASTSNIVISGGDDGTLTITNYNSSTGLVNYTFDPTGTSRDHSAGDTSVIETYTLIATDANANRSLATDLDILITDTVPIANDDVRDRNIGSNITEGTSAIAGNAVGIAGSATGDNADTLVDANSTPVIDIDFGGTDGTPGSNLASTYGTFNINNAGVYTYTLDNTNPAVQGLKFNEFFEEEFVYTIQDGDGDTNTATITIGIEGVEDAAPIVAFNASPVSGGFRYTAAENMGFPAGQITLTATAGLSSTGTALQITPQGSSAINIPLSMLQAASPTNTLNIVGSVGTLNINGYSISGPNTTLSFVFEVAGVPGSFDHSINDPAQDFFDLLVTDNEGDTASTNVEFRLIDTAPTAAADAPRVNEGDFLGIGDVIAGNVLVGTGSAGADTTGADTAVSVSAITFMSAQQTVGTPFSAQYGSLDLNSDGTYTYTLDNSNGDVQALDNGESLVEEFTYTIIDTDGDTSTTDFVITIDGITN